MKHLDENEVARILRAAGTGEGRRTGRCPEESQIAAYVDANLHGTARQRLEGHVADCGFCLGQVGFLLRTREDEARLEVPVELLVRARELGTSSGRTPVLSAWHWKAAAAVATGVVLVGALWVWQPELLGLRPGAGDREAVSGDDARTVRGRPGTGIQPELLSPREGSLIDPTETEFRWREVRGSLFYEIRVATAEGDLVWEGRVEATRANLPGDVALSPASEYFVWVHAYLPEGKTVKSGVVGFRTPDAR